MRDLAGISIHAAREGGDAASAATASTETEFQSTPPVKAATGYSFLCWDFCWISIHAAREGGDTRLIHVFPERTISIHAAREGGD